MVSTAMTEKISGACFEREFKKFGLYIVILLFKLKCDTIIPQPVHNIIGDWF